MAACWRALGAVQDIRTFVFAFQIGTGEKTIAFSDRIMHGLPHRLLAAGEKDDAARIAELVADYAVSGLLP